MGMRVGGSGAAWANQSNAVGNWQQRQQNMKALGSALQGGDLAAAQQAFATISANNPAAAANSNSPLAKIGQALQAGDLASAQQAAQSWRSSRHEGAAAPAANGSPLANVNSATGAFLQTLTPLAAAPTATNGDPTAAPTSAATSDQIAQALAAFERNLFQSLQAQDPSAVTANGASTGSAATSATASGTATEAASPAVAPTSVASSAQAPVQGHHHHPGGGGAKLGEELSALIAQTATNSSSTATDGSAAATSPTTTGAATTASLDQSFKTLLTTLGVSGNNASLNTFLQAMSANMQSGGATIPAPASA